MSLVLHKPTLRQCNNGISLVVIILALYIFAWPYLPAISWKLHHLSRQPTSSELTDKVITKNVMKQDIPKENTLVIPRLELQLNIYEGPNASTLMKGPWHRPKTSSPDKGGNTVIAGHRFTTVPGIFYNLDKIQVGDPIIVYWQGKEYDYITSSVSIVEATRLSVEDNTKDARLTLYTCTPLWTFKNRLVVVANPMQEKKQ